MLSKANLGFILAVGIIFPVLTVQGLANKDMIYPSAATATVNGTSVTSSSNFSTGEDGHTTLNAAVYAADAVFVTATWSIQDRRDQPGQDTEYGTGLTATFSASTTTKPSGASNVTVGAISSCTLSSSSSTCSTVISFSAPATVGGYQLKIDVGGLGGNDGLATKAFYINFSVAEASGGKLDTKLTVAKKCYLLHQGDIDLTATLEELASTDPIFGAPVDFYVEPGPIVDPFSPPSSSSPVGTASTNVSGVATLSYNINSLGVGDYNLYAEFHGDDSYNPSNDSDILGISYLFVGFQQPINAEGNSIFGGRVIPIKIKLVDANGDPVTDAAPTVWLTSYDKDLGLGEELEKVSSVSAADTDNIMRYSALDQQYIYNWDAMDLPNGTYGVVVDLGDSCACSSGPHYAVITVARKTKK